MRKIKFKAWDKEKKIMCDVFNIQFDLGYAGIKALNYCVFEREIEKIILLQYTGLKDRNGKEIYEGDILDYLGDELMVEWDKEIAGWLFRKENQHYYYWFQIRGNCKVIGNIYEKNFKKKGE